MRAMVLAAGLGTRLRPLTETTPKPMIDVAGKPMIQYALELARDAGIREVAINLHHLGDQIRNALGDGSRLGMSIQYFPEDPILDTGGGVAAARAFLDGQPFVLLNADTITDVDLPAMIAAHRAHGALATLLLRPDPDVARYGVIEIDRRERIRRFLGRTPPDYVASEEAQLRPLMFGGVHVLEPRVVAYMYGGAYGITRVTYPRRRAAGSPLFGFVHEGFWSVLDTPAGLAAGRTAMQARLSK